MRRVTRAVRRESGMRGLAILALVVAALGSPSARAAPEPPGSGYSSEAMRRRAEEDARQRAAWWERQRAREAEERFRRDVERRREATNWQIRRWEEQRARRSWSRRTDMWP